MGPAHGGPLDLEQQPLRQGGGPQAEVQERVVVHVQVVLRGLLPGVGDHLHLGAGESGHELREVADPVGLRHLVEDLHAVAGRRGVEQGQLHAPDHVLEVDERPGLPAGAVHGQRVADRRLDEEAVEHRAVVAVVVEAGDEPLVERRLRGAGAPDDALVQVGDPQAVVPGVEREHGLVQDLGHVVQRAGVGGVEDLLGDRAVRSGDLHVQVALRDAHPGGAVPVDPHGAQVHHVDVQPGLHDRAQHVVRGADVVVHGVALRGRGAHGVRRRPLLREVHHGVRALDDQEVEERLVVGGEVDLGRADPPARQLLPGRAALVEAADGRQRLRPEPDVDGAAGEVVHHHHVVAARGQVQGRGPAAEAVAAEDRDLHWCSVPGPLPGPVVSVSHSAWRTRVNRE